MTKNRFLVNKIDCHLQDMSCMHWLPGRFVGVRACVQHAGVGVTAVAESNHHRKPRPHKISGMDLHSAVS